MDGCKYIALKITGAIRQTIEFCLLISRRLRNGAACDVAAGPASWILRFRCDRRGSVAITFAIALIPMLGLMGAAIDYGVAAHAKTKLDSIADAASLVAVDKLAMTISASSAQTSATDMFNAQASIAGVTLTNVTATATDNALGRTAIVNYTARVPTTFMVILGRNYMDVGGSSTAASALPIYMDFYLLLDNTPSMGVGATPADITTMVNNTSDQCAFACHQLDIAPNDYYGLAKSLGVTMRVDVLRTATQQLMDTATATETVPNQFRMAIYTFGSSASAQGLTTITPLTAALSDAKAAAAAIDLMTVPYQNYASDTDTDFDSVFSSINSTIPNPGDGLSSSAPQKLLFYVSDGVADEVNSTSCTQPTTQGKDPKTGKKYVRCQEPLTVSLCTTLKNRGVKIAVLYTTYLPLPTNSWYNSWISPFSSSIATNMQACASPGLYFEVSPTQGISAAMTALFQKAVQSARLTY